MVAVGSLAQMGLAHSPLSQLRFSRGVHDEVTNSNNVAAPRWTPLGGVGGDVERLINLD